jgi:hypothetical protein
LSEDKVWEVVTGKVLAFFKEDTTEFNEQIKMYSKEESDGERQKRKDAITCLTNAIKVLRSGPATEERRTLARLLEAEMKANAEAKLNAEVAKGKKKKTEEWLIELAESRNVEHILRKYNASKEVKRAWIGETVASVLQLSQQDYVDAVFQILRRTSGRASELMQAAIEKYLPSLPARTILKEGLNKRVFAELSPKQLKEQRALAHSQGLYSLVLWSQENKCECLHVFKQPEQLTASDLGTEARKLLWKCCDLPNVRERSTQPDEVIAFFAQLEEENLRKSSSEVLSPTITQVRDAFFAALFEKNGLQLLLRDQRERIRAWIRTKKSDKEKAKNEEEAKKKGKEKEEEDDDDDDETQADDASLSGDQGKGFYDQHEGRFISVDLKSANFAALVTLGYVGGLRSWSELIDEVVGPVERVAALFRCKWFRQFVLGGFLEDEVEREQRKAIREVCRALQREDMLSEDNMVGRNRDEVIIRIDDGPTEGQTESEFAAELRTKVERVLEEQLSAIRVEVFEVKRREYDLCTYAEKRNLENSSIQMKDVKSSGH